jgi:hypothetical protein
VKDGGAEFVDDAEEFNVFPVRGGWPGSTTGLFAGADEVVAPPNPRLPGYVNTLELDAVELFLD